MVPFLTVISGLAWTIVYIDSIRIGFRDKTYAMPIAALALNVAWESTYAVHDLMTSLSIQAFVNLTWALADLAIVFTFFKFGRAEFPSFVTRRTFAAWGLLVFGAAYAVQWLFLAEFGVHNASRYSAFLQNALMSGLFVQMVIARRGLRGQTLTIALAKWLGTLAPTILFGFIEGSHFLLFLGMICSVFDLVYIGLVLWFQVHQDDLSKDLVLAIVNTNSANYKGPTLRHDRTPFIQIDTRLCVACGKCVSACPRKVLGTVAVLGHRHVHVDHVSECKGCRKCANLCPQSAIQFRCDVNRKQTCRLSRST